MHNSIMSAWSDCLRELKARRDRYSISDRRHDIIVFNTGDGPNVGIDVPLGNNTRNNFAAVVGVSLKRRGHHLQDPPFAYESDGIATLLFMSSHRMLKDKKTRAETKTKTPACARVALTCA